MKKLYVHSQRRGCGEHGHFLVVGQFAESFQETSYLTNKDVLKQGTESNKTHASNQYQKHKRTSMKFATNFSLQIV